MNRIDSLIEQLQLQPHPEGGYFIEVYRSEESIRTDESGSYPDGRSFSTSIYYLLEGNDISHFHRIQSDEIWHHYEGGSATIHVITPEGDYRTLLLGKNIDDGESYQHVVPGGSWFAVSVNDPSGFLLAGCTVAPGFDFRDFELAEQNRLIDQFPEHKSIITRFCK